MYTEIQRYFYRRWVVMDVQMRARVNEPMRENQAARKVRCKAIQRPAKPLPSSPAVRRPAALRVVSFTVLSPSPLTSIPLGFGHPLTLRSKDAVFGSRKILDSGSPNLPEHHSFPIDPIHQTTAVRCEYSH